MAWQEGKGRGWDGMRRGRVGVELRREPSDRHVAGAVLSDFLS